MPRKLKMYSLLSLFPAPSYFLWSPFPFSVILLIPSPNCPKTSKFCFKFIKRDIFIKRSIFIKRGMVTDHCHHCSLSPSFTSWHERLDVQNNIICASDLQTGARAQRLQPSGSHCAREMAGAHVLLEGWEQRMLRGLHWGHVSHNKLCEIISTPSLSLSCCDKCVKALDEILDADGTRVHVEQHCAPKSRYWSRKERKMRVFVER